jgi:hypothetical protein
MEAFILTQKTNVSIYKSTTSERRIEVIQITNETEERTLISSQICYLLLQNKM